MRAGLKCTNKRLKIQYLLKAGVGAFGDYVKHWLNFESAWTEGVYLVS